MSDDSAFCEGYDEDTCPSCPKHNDQHPCFSAKMKYMAQNGLRLGKDAIPSRNVPGEGGNAPPAPRSDASIMQAEVRDDRGWPLLGAALEPITKKQVVDMGEKKLDKRLRELRSGQIHSNTTPFK